MAGGPSQMETFDYKPVLNARNGEQLPDSVRQGQRLTGMSGNQSSLPLAGSQFGFSRHGASGTLGSATCCRTRQDRTSCASSDRCAPTRSTTIRRLRSSRADRRSPAGRAWVRGFTMAWAATTTIFPRSSCSSRRARSISLCTRACGAAGSCRRSTRGCSFGAARMPCFISAIQTGSHATAAGCCWIA